MVDVVGEEVRFADLCSIDTADHFLKLRAMEFPIVRDEKAFMDGGGQDKEVSAQLFRRLVHEFRKLYRRGTVDAALDGGHPHGGLRHIHHAAGHFRHHLGHVLQGRRAMLHLGSHRVLVELFRGDAELVQHLVRHQGAGIVVP